MLQGKVTTIGGRSCSAVGTFLYVHSVAGWQEPKFLTVQRISKLVRNLFKDVAPDGGSGNFQSKHWRHVSGSCVALVSSVSTASAMLHHADESTFRKYYCISIPGSFLDRWRALPAVERGALSPQERLLI